MDWDYLSALSYQLLYYYAWDIFAGPDSLSGPPSPCHSRTVEVGHMINRFSCVKSDVAAVTSERPLDLAGHSIFLLPPSLPFGSYPELDLRVSG